MLVTPTSSRMTPPAWGLRLTPSNSSYTRNPSAKSPMKPHRQELSLSLKQVIGATTNSVSAFDSLSSARCFTFTAGAAAVVAHVGDDGQITQQFYRARPTTAPLNPLSSAYGPSTPINGAAEARNRTAAALRDAGMGMSLFGSPAVDWADSPSGKAWTARERVKAATCVSLSPDGRYLAVGEIGYKPRVLIFSTSKEGSRDTPWTCLTDHTFGVRCVAFSPDSQYLASLGCANDGFLYIWSINNKNGLAALYASNKCTVNIRQIAWIGTNIITVGTRHVKVWRLEDPNEPSKSTPSQNEFNQALTNTTAKTLQGRNCLLGPLLEATFTSIAVLSSNKAIIGSDRGDVCLLDDTDGTQRFTKVASVDFPITAMTLDSMAKVRIAGTQGNFRSLKSEDLVVAKSSPASPTPSNRLSLSPGNSDSAHVVAMAPLGDKLVTVDSRRAIKLLDFESSDVDSDSGTIAHKLPAHGEAILGVRSLPDVSTFDASFFTWSADGTIIFWDQDSTPKRTFNIELEQMHGYEDNYVNELKVVRASKNVEFLVLGDKYGVLRVMNGETGDIAFATKAHAGEITDITIHEGKSTFVASSGRDRTVQVFQRNDDSWELLQTLDEHVGAVTGVLFSRAGDRLLSSSSDRTVMVRDAVSKGDNEGITVGFLISRTITLKASPTSLTLDWDRDDILLLATVDRQVHRLDLRTGQSTSSFKVSDPEGGDAVVLSSLLHFTTFKGMSIVAGVSSTDKSIRLYDDNGSLLNRDWGHTEGLSDIALVTSQSGDSEIGVQSLVTVAVDGTIFVWSLAPRSAARYDQSKSVDLLSSTPNDKDTIAAKPPLRRVLSQSELVRFQKSHGEEVSTPSPSRSPKDRKKPSTLSLSRTPKLDPSPLPGRRGSIQMSLAEGTNRKSPKQRSPSPPSPSPRVSRLSQMRRPSIGSRAKSASNASEFGSLAASTEQVCRTLKAYRKKLANSSDNLSTETVRELERELGLTARAVGEKAIKSKSLDENAMVKLLDQYSERLVAMLDEKITASLSKQGRATQEGDASGGAEGGTAHGGTAASENQAPVVEP